MIARGRAQRCGDWAVTGRLGVASGGSKLCLQKGAASSQGKRPAPSGRCGRLLLGVDEPRVLRTLTGADRAPRPSRGGTALPLSSPLLHAWHQP